MTLASLLHFHLRFCIFISKDLTHPDTVLSTKTSFLAEITLLTGSLIGTCSVLHLNQECSAPLQRLADRERKKKTSFGSCFLYCNVVSTCEHAAAPSKGHPHMWNRRSGGAQRQLSAILKNSQMSHLAADAPPAPACGEK